MILPPLVSAPESILLDNFTDLSVNKNFFLYGVNNLKTLDLNTIYDDNVVVFPRNIYSGEPVAPPIKKGDIIDPSTLYIVPSPYDLSQIKNVYRDMDGTTWNIHPQHSSMFTFDSRRHETYNGGSNFCPFGYCNGPQSGRDYMLGKLL